MGLGLNSGLWTGKARHSASWATSPVCFPLIILEMGWGLGSLKLFAQTGLDPQSSQSISASQVIMYRCEPPEPGKFTILWDHLSLWDSDWAVLRVISGSPLLPSGRTSTVFPVTLSHGCSWETEISVLLTVLKGPEEMRTRKFWVGGAKC
jgi:hypothetical protein